MLRRSVFIGLLLVSTLGAGLALAAAKAPARPAAKPAAAKPVQVAADGTLTATVNFPQGNVDAGRLVFHNLKCFVCHEVAGKEGQGMKVRTAVSAPLLDSRLAAKDPGEVITSVIAPSHKVSDAVAKESGGKLSPMGDFTSSLTVRQLIDLVAFLRSIDETKK
jgi:mono/diheme cytochrome c family protein